MKTIAIGFALILTAASAHAQGTSDARWAPWLGCWELVTENLRDATTSRSERTGPTTLGSSLFTPRNERTADEGRPRICVTPAGQGGATFTTTIADRTALEQTIVADGAEQPITDAECRGTHRAEWSADGLRLFATARLTCSGDKTPRRVSSLSLFAPDGSWLDIQAVQVDSRESIQVRRYRRSAAQAPGVSPRVAGARLTLDDVKEASTKVAAPAVEAALVETNASFDLTSRSLLDLDEAGVPASLIDLMVALSYPERFVVERQRNDRAGMSFIDDPFIFGGAFGYPAWLDFGLYSPLYASYYSPYYYSPFAYSYLGRYDPRFSGGSFIVVDGGGATSSSPQPSGAGRAVDGLGYTRVRPRETPAATSTSTMRTRGDANSGASSPAPATSSGGATSQGYSGGGSSGDTGRTAVPR